MSPQANARMSAKVYLSVFFGIPALCFILAVVSGNKAFSDFMVSACQLSAFIGIVFFARKAWSLLSYRPDRRLPNSAWFLLVPIFNIFWTYYVIFPLGRIVSEEVKSRGMTDVEVADALSKAFCHLAWVGWILIIVGAFGVLVSPGFGVIGIAGAVLLLVWLVVTAIMFVHYSSVINRLMAAGAKTEAEGSQN
jgi:hypothetical protein